MAPRDHSRGLVGGQRRKQRARLGTAGIQQAQAFLAGLKSASTALASALNGSLPPKDLETATTAAMWLADTFLEFESDKGFLTLMQLTWGSVQSCANLLLLHTAATRALTSTALPPHERSTYEQLHYALSMLLYFTLLTMPDRCEMGPGDPGIRCSLLLLEQMAKQGTLATLSVLLAAGTSDSRCRLPPDIQEAVVTIVMCTLEGVETLLKIADIAADGNDNDGYGGSDDEELADAGRYFQVALLSLEAVAKSSIVEHSVRCILLCATEASPPTAPGDAAPAPLRTCRPLLGPNALLCYLSRVIPRLGKRAQGRVDGDDSSSCSTSSSGSAGGDNSSEGIELLVSCIHTLLSGPNLRYALALQFVSQLAAADGGPTYGLKADCLLPVWTAAHERATTGRPTRAGGGGGRGQNTTLECNGLEAALHCWSIGTCLTPPVKSVVYSSDAVYELSMRLVRVATRSAALYTAPHHQLQPPPMQRQQPQGKLGRPNQQGTRGGAAAVDAAPRGVPAPAAAVASASTDNDTGQLMIPVGVDACGNLTLKALLSGALTRLLPPLGRHGRAEGAGGGGTGPDGALGGGPEGAAGAVRFWSAAVPALHAVLDLAEAGSSGGEPVPPLATIVLKLHLPCWSVGDLPPSPAPDLAAALAAGYVPLLERALRTQLRCSPDPHGSAVELLTWLCSSWAQLGRVMAYGEPQQVAALLATMTKVPRQLSRGKVVGGGSASRGVLPACKEAVGVLPLEDMFNWMETFAVACRAEAGVRAGDGACANPATSATCAPAGSTTTAAVTHGSATVCCSLAALAAVGVEPCSPPCDATCYAALADIDVGGDAGGEGCWVVQWAPQPTEQLLAMQWMAARQWLPLLAQATLAELRQPLTGQSRLEVTGTINTMLYVRKILEWVPALVQAYTQARDREEAAPGASGPSSGSGAAPAAQPPSQQQQSQNQQKRKQQQTKKKREQQGRAQQPEQQLRAGGDESGAGAESWRRLLFEEVELLALLQLTLRRLKYFGAYHKAMEAVAIGTLYMELSAAVACMRDVFLGDAWPGAAPCEASRSEFLDQVQEQEGLWAVERVQHAMSARRTDNDDDDADSSSQSEEKPCATAEEVGALLLRAAAQPPPFRTCGNPACANLAGPSEMALHLKVYGGCDAVSYCGPECQREHGRAGHRQGTGALGPTGRAR